MGKGESRRKIGSRGPSKPHCSGTTTLVPLPSSIGHRESMRAGCLHAHKGMRPETSAQCQKRPLSKADINLGLEPEVMLFFGYRKGVWWRWAQDDLSALLELWGRCAERSHGHSQCPFSPFRRLPLCSE